MLDLTPKYLVLPAEQEVLLPEPFSEGGPAQVVGGWAAGSGQLSQGKISLQATQERILIGDATEPLTGTGIFIGSDGAATIGYDFRAGNPAGNYIHWDASAATLTIVGSITATSGTIGGWSINSTSIYTGTEDHSAYTANAGDITLYSDGSNASIHAFNWYIDASGVFNTRSGAMSGVSITSIPNDTNTDISVLEYTHDLVFSVTDLNTVAWATGTITLSNGRTFSITGSNTGNMAARTYIYLDPVLSSSALQTTTTASTAMGANKILIAVAQNQTAEASFTVYGGIGGLKLREADTSIANNNWVFSGTWTLTDANTVTWGSGTLTVSNGNSYSITGAGTGNMTQKTYIYFALGTSSTAFQTTTTRSTAVGAGKILIAIAEDGTDEPTLIVMNDDQFNIDAANIVAGSITANEISTGTITADRMNVTILSAIAADLGTITAGSISGITIAIGSGNSIFKADSNGIYLGNATFASAPFRVSMAGALTATSATITGSITATSGAIGGWTINAGSISADAIPGGGNFSIASSTGRILIGAASAPLTGNGIFIGEDGMSNEDFDFRVGDPAATYMHWDDSAGTLNLIGASLNVGTTGNVRGGQTAYNTGTGFFLGYESSAHKFSIGNPAGNYITWDGTTLTIVGNQVQITTYSSGSGNWTKPTGCKSVHVQMWGAGGAGGGANGTGDQGAGGGGGAFNEYTYNASDLGSTVAYAVGAGGTGDTDSGPAGGDTSFGTLFAYGGGGGGGGGSANSGGGGGGIESAGATGIESSGTDAGGAGGEPIGGAGTTGATGGTSVFGGGGGGPSGGGSNFDGGRSVMGGGGGGSALQNGAKSHRGGGGGGGGNSGGAGGSGGASIFGGAGGAGGNTSANGSNGTAPGGGGGGAAANSGTTRTGGNGGAGKIIVTAFL